MVNNQGQCISWIQDFFGECVTNAQQTASVWISICSLFIFIIAQLPQMYNILAKKDVSSISFLFLLLWTIGDVFNIIGSILTLHTSLYFYVALLLLLIDVVLLLQWLYFYFKKLKHQADSQQKHSTEHLQIQQENHTYQQISADALKPSKMIKFHPQLQQEPLHASFSINNRRESMVSESDSELGGFDTDQEDDPTMVAIPTQSALPKQVVVMSNSKSFYNKPSSSGATTTTTTTTLNNNNSPFKASLPPSMSMSSISYSYSNYGSMKHHLHLFPLLIVASFVVTRVKSVDGYGRTVWPLVFVEEIIGYIFGCLSTILYCASRIPQIMKNMKRRNCRGLSSWMFSLTILGNILYCTSMVIFEPENPNYFFARIPWFFGSIGTIIFDIIILIQIVVFHKRSRIKIHL